MSEIAELQAELAALRDEVGAVRALAQHAADRGAVENLFNREYFPTADGDNNITPGAPLTLRLTWVAAL